MYARERKYNKNRIIKMRIFYGLVLFCNIIMKSTSNYCKKFIYAPPINVGYAKLFQRSSAFSHKTIGVIEKVT